MTSTAFGGPDLKTVYLGSIAARSPVVRQYKAAQLIAIRSLLDEIAFAFEDREAVRQAAEIFEQGTCGFSDCLVAAKHARHGCEFTATFDRGMRKLRGVRLL